MLTLVCHVTSPVLSFVVLMSFSHNSITIMFLHLCLGRFLLSLSVYSDIFILFLLIMFKSLISYITLGLWLCFPSNGLPILPALFIK